MSIHSLHRISILYQELLLFFDCCDESWPLVLSMRPFRGFCFQALIFQECVRIPLNDIYVLQEGQGGGGKILE